MIGPGSFVALANGYTLATVAGPAGFIAADCWACVPVGGAPQIWTVCREPDLFEVGFTVFPPGFSPGDIVDWSEPGPHWGVTAGPGIPMRRGKLLYAVTLGGGLFEAAWVQCEHNGPGVMVLWGALTVLRPGSGVP